jgi:hypothetical protein
MHTPDPEPVLEQLFEILRIITAEELDSVFQAWVDRVRHMRDGNGDYIAE